MTPQRYPTILTRVLRGPPHDKRGYVKSSAGVGDDNAEDSSVGSYDDDSFRSFSISKHGRSRYQVFKRVFDIVFSLVVIMLSILPVLALCLLICIESKGSPIYQQRRVGLQGKPLNIFKLRTMVKDSYNVDKYLSEKQREQWQRERKVDNDPRITNIGRFLRKTSLDELPQFVNVLMGQMSIIGPRCITEDELLWYGRDAALLLSVPPGITGWWQVMARNEAKYEDGSRQDLELYYVQNAGFCIDISIFFKTFLTILSKTGQ